MFFLPDGPIVYRRINGAPHVFGPAGGITAHLSGSDFNHLGAAFPNGAGGFNPSLGPSGSGFDANYAGAMGMVAAANGTDLLMIYHAEQYPNGGAQASTCTIEGIGLARSSDGGATWTRQGQILSSALATVACNGTQAGFQGAGEPTVVPSADRQYLYMYFTDYHFSSNFGIFLARAPVASDGVPGSWTKYYQGSFSQPGLGGGSATRVIEPPASAGGGCGGPSVSYNIYLARFLMFMNCPTGIFYTSSVDGIAWDTPQQIWAVQTYTNLGSAPNGTRWVEFPTYFSHDQPNSNLTGQNGFLYFATGTKIDNAFVPQRSLNRVPVSLVDSLVRTASAVLPASRSVQVSKTATAFATMINSTASDATGCALGQLTQLPGTFSFQTTDPATNAVTGSPNAPVNLKAGAAQTFVFAFTPTAAFYPDDLEINFTCSGILPAPITIGLNTLLMSASATPVPDIVALGATSKNDGIVHVSGGIGAFAVATVNVGASSPITVSADTGQASIPVQVTLCETNPSTGQCISAVGPSVNTTINANATPTFAIFVQGTSGNIPFDPTNGRIFVRFKDGGGITRGSTGVAVTTQ